MNNKLQVTISDGSTPIVLLWGARCTGKTMSLIRMVRYLRGVGYSINDDSILLPHIFMEMNKDIFGNLTWATARP